MPDDASASPTEDASPAPIPQLIGELKDLVGGYVRQETVVPLKSLGRYLGFGIAGAFLLGIGALLLGVGLLRVLQEETGDTFAGDYSFAPYLITFVALIVGGALTWAARGRTRRRKEA